MNNYQTPPAFHNTVASDAPGAPGAPKKPEVPYTQKDLIEVQKQLRF